MKLIIITLVLIALTGCKATEPLQGKCVVEPLEIDFGSLLPPQSDTETRTVSHIITISNLPLNTSPAGNENVKGTLKFRMQASQTNPPLFHLTPEGTDPNFDIPNNGSVSAEVVVSVVSNTSTGGYAGTIELGNLCNAIPFVFQVSAREEASPVFSLQWGTEGIGFGEFRFPNSCAVDAEGNVFVVDQANRRIQKFDGNGNFSGYWYEWDQLDTEEELTSFFIPVAVAVDSKGYVYVTDVEPEHNVDRITKFDNDGNYVKHLGPTRSGGLFGLLSHVDVDTNDHIYSVDRGSFLINKYEFTETGVRYNKLASWGGWGTGPGQFRSPYGLAVDPRNGDVYVSDTLNNNIQKFTSNGAYLLGWGREGAGGGEFDNPFGLTVDNLGNVFVVDHDNRRVQKFDENGAFLTEWGEIGTGPGKFADLIDVAVDSSGNIFLVEFGTHRIHKFVPPAALEPTVSQ